MQDIGSLPFIGPATALFRFSPDDPLSVVQTLRGDDRLFAEAEIAVARCDFAKARDLYGALSTSDRYFPSAVRIGVISAIGLGDLPFLDRVLNGVRRFRESVKNDPTGQKLADIVEGWVRQWLWCADGFPDWIRRFDYSDLPQIWWRAAAYIGVTARLNAGDFESAYAMAAVLMSFSAESNAPTPGLTAERVCLQMARAIACRETGRVDEMRKWLSEVIHELAPHGFLLPFALFMHGTHKSPVEEILSEVAPDEVLRYREVGRTYFTNLVRARNHIFGEKATDKLSVREFYFAMLLKRDFSYKELADRFGLSVGRIKNILSVLYQKLHIHSRAKIKELVW